MASRREGWARVELLENQTKHRAGLPENFKSLFPGKLLLALLALPAPLDHDDEDNEQGGDPGRDRKILAQLETDLQEGTQDQSSANDK